ncbi:MAG: hypothetical protein WAK89_13035 [Candidatus Sulfotelmatobacter sp.]
MIKKIGFAVGTLLVGTLLWATPRFIAISGFGVGIDPDQSTADQTADQNAQQQLQTNCMGGAGQITQSHKTSDTCGPVGSNIVCNVAYAGTCQVGY